jgi:hypothetical protein
MIRFFIYLFLLGLVLYVFSALNRSASESIASSGRSRRWFKPKKNPREIWTQVYETATLDEARLLQARLQEHEIDCIIYEPGKRDIHGNELKGFGIAVPKSTTGGAQGIISRMSV